MHSHLGAASYLSLLVALPQISYAKTHEKPQMERIRKDLLFISKSTTEFLNTLHHEIPANDYQVIKSSIEKIQQSFLRDCR